jgi:hypothetical protein
VSVFKGVDLGFGYAWYRSNNEEVWGSGNFERVTPIASARATWTVLYGFQLSYAVDTYWPTSLNESIEAYHSVRFRLLLREVFAGPSRKAYHPDLEFSYDTGKRLPLFQQERMVTLGFTFDLYPR